MSEMPFGTLSVQMLWKLFFLMHEAESGNLQQLCCALQPAECKKQLQGKASPKQVVSASPTLICLSVIALVLLRRTKRMVSFEY
jgi:hypothetical protein